MAEEEKDYLGEFIKKNEYKEEPNKELENVEFIGNNVRKKVEHIESTFEEQWQNIPIESLPFHKYYPLGTKIFIRPAKTKEIEAFSAINEKNQYDVHLKIIQMLKSCVQIKYFDKSYGTYKDIMFGDRDVLLMLISNLTFKSERRIKKETECKNCGTINEIEFIPANYTYKEEPEKIKKYFNAETRSYHFELKTKAKVKMRPPTVGIIESLNEYIFYETLKSQQESPDNQITYTPNTSFIENITYLKSGENITELSIKEWKQEEYEYTQLNKELFMFIDEARKLLDIGIKHVEQICKNEGCDETTKIPFQYPDGIRSLFIIPNAFDDLIA